MPPSQVIVISIALDRLAVVRRPLHYSGELNLTWFTVAMVMVGATSSAYLYTAFYGVSADALVTVCSMGAAAGPLSNTWSAIASQSAMVLLVGMRDAAQGVGSICLLFSAIYIYVLVLFVQQTRGNRNEQRANMHAKITVSIMMLLFMYALFWSLSTGILLAAPVRKMILLPERVKHLF